MLSAILSLISSWFVLILFLRLCKSPASIYMYIWATFVFFPALFFSKRNKICIGLANLRHGSCKFTCWFSGRFFEAFGGLSCVRLLSGEKTPLCKNICCGNGCQTPFCGLCLFFAQRLSFVAIIYVGERVTVKNVECGAVQSSSLHFGCFHLFCLM